MLARPRRGAESCFAFGLPGEGEGVLLSDVVRFKGDGCVALSGMTDELRRAVRLPLLATDAVRVSSAFPASLLIDNPTRPRIRRNLSVEVRVSSVLCSTEFADETEAEVSRLLSNDPSTSSSSPDNVVCERDVPSVLVAVGIACRTVYTLPGSTVSDASSAATIASSLRTGGNLRAASERGSTCPPQVGDSTPPRGRYAHLQ